MSGLEVRLPDDQLERLAELVAERVSPGTPQGWLNAKQAGEYLGCSVNRIHDLVTAGKLQHARQGRRIVTKPEWLDAVLEVA